MSEQPREKSLNSQELPPRTPPPSPLKQIRTYQGDIAEALDTQQESLVSIQQTAYEKKRANPEAFVSEDEISKRRRGVIALSLGSFFLIVLGIIGGSYAYNEYKSRTAPPTLSVPSNRFIAPTSEVSIDLSTLEVTREALFTAFDKEVEDLKAGELRHVILRKGERDIAPLMKTSELFAFIETQAPGSLVRAFDPLFMLGALEKSRFIIIKLASFENAFPGMLSWESTLAEDLGPLLASEEALQVLTPSNVFRDVIIKNKDVRMLEGGTSTSTEAVLMYSFFDNNMLIITDKLSTLEAVLERLTRAKLSR